MTEMKKCVGCRAPLIPVVTNLYVENSVNVNLWWFTNHVAAQMWILCIIFGVIITQIWKMDNGQQTTDNIKSLSVLKCTTLRSAARYCYGAAMAALQQEENTTAGIDVEDNDGVRPKQKGTMSIIMMNQK
jgi:hypothetical protein